MLVGCGGKRACKVEENNQAQGQEEIEEVEEIEEEEGLEPMVKKDKVYLGRLVSIDNNGPARPQVA